jgi:hypothetical protein
MRATACWKISDARRTILGRAVQCPATTRCRHGQARDSAGRPPRCIPQTRRSVQILVDVIMHAVEIVETHIIRGRRTSECNLRKVDDHFRYAAAAIGSTADFNLKCVQLDPRITEGPVWIRVGSFIAHRRHPSCPTGSSWSPTAAVLSVAEVYMRMLSKILCSWLHPAHWHPT